jgi:formamidopyrimidine-DNA glycosylase
VSVMGLVNHLRNPKQWAIAHENGPEKQKRWVFGHASQTCTKCHGPCTAINAKTMSFWSCISNKY